VIDESQGLIEASRMNFMHSSGIVKSHQGRIVPASPQRFPKELVSVVRHVPMWPMERFNNNCMLLMSFVYYFKRLQFIINLFQILWQY